MVRNTQKGTTISTVITISMLRVVAKSCVSPFAAGLDPQTPTSRNEGEIEDQVVMTKVC